MYYSRNRATAFWYWSFPRLEIEGYYGDFGQRQAAEDAHGCMTN